MSSSSPIKYTRKWYLNRLCTAIFGRVKIGYEVDKNLAWILPKSGFADKCDFKVRNSMAVYRTKMETLMYYIFLCDNTSFDLKYKDGDFSRDVAIQNALDFFKDPEGDSTTTGIGINVHDYAADNNSDAKLLFIGLSEYILRTIFEASPNSENYATENIQDSFRQCLISFNNYLLQFTVFRNNYANFTNEECYFDPRFSQHPAFENGKTLRKQTNEFNYAVPINISELFSLPRFPIVNIIIPVGSSQYTEPSKEEKFQRIVKGYIPLSTDTQEFVLDTTFYNQIYISNRFETLEFSLSDIIPQTTIYDHIVYFFTCIDISILETFYQNPESHEELHRHILIKAKSYIKQQNPDYKHIEDDYAQLLLDNIEDVITRFHNLICYKEFVQSNEPDEITGNKILNIFQIPFDKVFNSFSEIKSTNNPWKIIYLALENAFIYYQRMLSDQHVIDFIRENTSNNARNNHIDHCKKIIQSDEFDTAIDLQKEKRKKTQDVIYISPSGFEYKRIPDFISNFKRAVESYLNQLNM